MGDAMLRVAVFVVFMGGAARADEKFFVVDLAPVGNIPSSTFTHRVTFVADRPPPMKPLNWGVNFSPDKTPRQVRDRAFDSFKNSNAKVEKLGETKLLVYGCLKLDLKTQTHRKQEFPPEWRPTVKEYATEEEARKGK